MTRHGSAPDRTPQATRRIGRRSVLGMIGGVPLAAGGVWAATGLGATADADDASGRTPAALRPGGELDRYIAGLAAEDKYSGTFLLAHHGRTVLARSYGMADKRRGVPNGPGTRFSLGSVTKLFTSVAIAQLAQAGKVGYQAKVGAYLDGFPPAVADAVTVQQLLTHTSGLSDSMDNPAFWADAATWTSERQVMDGQSAWARKSPVRFTPGADHGYSNDGFQVLGMIVEKASGQSYYDYVREHIFRAAGMADADFSTITAWRSDPRFAHPYPLRDGRRVDAVDEFMFVGSPAGSSFATADDLVRFAQALLGGKLLDRPFTDLTVGPKVAVPPPPAPPGAPAVLAFESYGPLVKLSGGQWTAGHTGGAPGVATNLEWFPGTDWIMVDLGNYDGDGTRLVDGMARTLITQSARQ